MKLRGNVFKYGDNINTDEIIPARYLNTSNPKILGKYCMEDIDRDFTKKVRHGDIIVAGRNFGCGSSREHAPIAIKAAGVSCVIAKSYARIFYRNSINTGLPILECSEAADEAEMADKFEVDLDRGIIKNLTKGKTYKSQPFPKFVQGIIRAGGLMKWVKAGERE